MKEKDKNGLKKVKPQLTLKPYLHLMKIYPPQMYYNFLFTFVIKDQFFENFFL